MTLAIAQLKSNQAGFWEKLEALTTWDSVADEQVMTIVREIIEAVKQRKDAALLEYTRRFDRMDSVNIADLVVDRARLAAAWHHVSPEQRDALNHAKSRIEAYHHKQLSHSWVYEEADGTQLGQQVTPIEKVGLYVPGGKAAYPSTVLMSAIPAKVAGVKELIMTVPTPGGEVNELVFAAAYLTGVDRVITVGGAQAVAALAYGTATVPRVDKIVGPGNIYVATAKSLVYGQVGIDMVAGPSEVLIIADGSTDPDWVAMDLFSQAEHDENAQSILVCPRGEYLQKVRQSMEKLLPGMERRTIIAHSLERRALLVEVDSLEEAARVTDFIAPEHCELSMENALAFYPKIHNAGAIFIGPYASEALGDYCAGPNHVLPTSRTARFSSPLGVYDFQKRSSLIFCNAAGAKTLGKTAAVLARSEGLTAHARSAEYRFGKV